MDSTNLEKYKDQIKKSVLLTHYLPFNKPYDAGSRCVLICQCRKTNESVTVTAQQLPSTYNVKHMLENAFTHPQITPLINCIADTKANLLIGVSTNPSGKYIEDYAKENKDKTKSFFRRNVQFIMMKLLTLLNAMHERGNGLHPFNEKSVILTTTNGGDIIDLVVRRCHLYCKSKSQTKQKAHLLYVARNMGYIGDDIEKDNLMPVELEFFRACHQKSEVTIAELMEMRYIKKDPESWVPKDKVIGGYAMNCTSVKKDNVVVPEAAAVSVDKTVKMFDLSALKTVGAATVSVDTTSDEDNMSVHTAIEAETEPSVPEKVAEPTEELLEWTVVRNLGDDTKFLSKSIVTVEDYIKKQASFKNAVTEGSDDHFGFQIPNLGKSLIQGTYLSKSGFIKVGGKAHSVFVDRINFPCALEILFDDRNIRHIRHNGIAYITFDSLPSKIADQLVVARVAFNHLNASAPIYIANSKKYNTKFTLSRNWEITLQNDAYEVVLTSEDIINGKEIDTLVTNENCRQTLKMALKKPLREPCSPRNKRILPSCDFKANENEMKIVATKVTGTVKYYSFEHNVGFITRDDGKDDIYVHQKRIVKSSLTPWERYLVAGEKVEFDVGQYKMGDPEAVNVTGPDGSEVEGDYVLVQRKHFPRP